MTSAPAIGFEYRSSPLLRRATLVVAALAAIAVLCCALAVWLKLLLVAAVLAAAWRSGHRLRAGRVAAAGWSAENDWTLRLADHEDVPAQLASFRVLGSFVLLRLRTTDHGVQVLLLAPDNSDADIRRRLRMRLAVVEPAEAMPRL